MKRLPSSLAAPALLACAALSACGTTGGTSRFVLPLDLPASEKVTAQVHVASAAMGVDTAYLYPVNVQPWGKFTADDLRNIEQSLQDTIAPYLAATSRATEPAVDIHLVVRRYVVGVSNTAGAALACVAWAATTPKGSVIHAEQFYAWDAGYLVTTIGRIKDAVHKAIVRRIAQTALALAQGRGASARPTRFEKTSTSFEEAASHLPQSLMSLGDPALAAFPNRTVGVVGLLTPSGMATMEWKVAHPSQAFDWTGYLNKIYGP